MSHHKDTANDVAKEVLRLVEAADLFRDQQGRSYGTFYDGGQAKTFRLDGKTVEIRRLLAGLCHEKLKQTIGASDLDDVIECLAARALLGPIREVFCRVGRAGECIILDLCRDDGRVVAIHPGWWEVSAVSPAKFRRPKGMWELPLPHRQPGTLAEALAVVFGRHDPEEVALAAAYLVGGLNPDIPLPVLELVGPQGSAKSTRTKTLRYIIDPSYVLVRRIPRSERDLFLAANNSWVLCLDNVSSIPDWVSDAICSIATGGGYATRKLYEDEDEALFSVRRPVMVNSIHEVLVRPDLRDRAIPISLPQLRSDQRIPEKEYWRRFHEAHPRILAALLDCAAAALFLENAITPDRLPRMADWYRWVLAATEEPIFGIRPTEFEAIFNGSRNASRECAIDASPIGRPLLGFAAENEAGWQGTLADLLSALNQRIDTHQQIHRSWPQSPQILRNAIDRIASDLRSEGLSVSFTRSTDRNRDRLVHLSWLSN